MTEEEKKQAARDRMAKARAAKKTATATVDTQIQEPNPEIKELPKPVVAEANIKWFGEVDLNQHRKIAVDYPAWYFDVQVDQLKNEISERQRNIDLGIYSGKDLIKQREILKNRKGRLEAIESSKPKLEGKDKDAVVQVHKDIGERIKESMFTYDEMWKQSQDAHYEADRMVKPSIEIRSQVEADFCKQRGIKVVNGKVSRNDASLMYKIFGKSIGENTDVELLRRQRGTSI
jgi:hypothetical protein